MIACLRRTCRAVRSWWIATPAYLAYITGRMAIEDIRRDRVP
ncbi:hypothetical protein [Amycolatopsis magusensis]